MDCSNSFGPCYALRQRTNKAPGASKRGHLPDSTLHSTREHRRAPTIESAKEALAYLRKLLKPPRTDGTGYRDPTLSPVLEEGNGLLGAHLAAPPISCKPPAVCMGGTPTPDIRSVQCIRMPPALAVPTAGAPKYWYRQMMAHSSTWKTRGVTPIMLIGGCCACTWV